LINTRMITGRLVVLLVAFSLLVAAGCGNNRAVAEVSGQKITRAALNTFTSVLKLLWPGQLEEMMADNASKALLEQDILETMISQHLIRQAVSEFGLAVSDEELEESYQLDRVQVVEIYGSEEAFRQKLQELKLTEKDLKDLLNFNAYRGRLHAFFLNETSDDEIRVFLADNPEFAVTPAMIEPSHILLETEEEARAVRERVLAGEDFADLAEELSIEPAAKQTRGYLAAQGEIAVNAPGWDPAFMAAAAAMEVGEISEPVQTQLGWHLIILHSKTEEAKRSFEEVRDTAADAVASEKMQAFLSEKREQAAVKISL